MRRPSAQTGFSLIEVMVVIAIIGVFAAVAIPFLGELTSGQHLRRAARNGADLVLLARAEAIRTGNNHIVFFGNPGDTDPGGTVLQDTDGNFTPIVVLDDGPPATSNCRIDGGEDLEYLQAEPEIGWGVTEASAQAPGDNGTGAMAGGWTFEDPASNSMRWILFRPDGIPVAFTVAAGVCNQVFDTGTGSGGFYITDGQRDFAIVVTALGNVRVRHWQLESSNWSG